jgi:hypothetical protein
MLRDDMTHLDQERLEHSGRSDLEASVEEPRAEERGRLRTSVPGRNCSTTAEYEQHEQTAQLTLTHALHSSPTSPTARVRRLASCKFPAVQSLL